MTDRAELEGLSSKELHDRAMKVAKHRLDVGFLWELIRTIPAAEAAAGNVDEATEDVAHVMARLEDLRHDDEGELAEALRPMYIDYLEEHEHSD